jgi:hypothetical protein
VKSLKLGEDNGKITGSSFFRFEKATWFFGRFATADEIGLAVIPRQIDFG